MAHDQPEAVWVTVPAQEYPRVGIHLDFVD